MSKAPVNSSRRVAGAEPAQTAHIPKNRADRGLPDEAARRDLAKTYLELQGKLWPKLIDAGVIPRPTKAAIQKLADLFLDRFVGNLDLPADSLPALARLILAAAYIRYSSDNSNPRSLDQQLRNILERAHRDEAFVPWEFVCADSAITGTTSNRRGYQMAKQLIKLKQGGPSRLYFDELGRASRDAIESLRLGRAAEAAGKRLIGISDGFDSDSPQSKLLLSMYAMLNEWFVDQLKAKVERGMRDAFRQGKNIQPPSFGYMLQQLLDDFGNPVCDEDGSPTMKKVVDPEAAPFVVEAFERFASDGWSPENIGRDFNVRNVGGKPTWNASRVRKLLRRETYTGIECYGMTRQIRNHETGGVTIEKRHRSEWIKRDCPELRIISQELWDFAQRRIAEVSEAFSKRRKGEPSGTPYLTSLFRLVCGYCGSNLRLGHSSKYASYCCGNGTCKRHGCKLTSYKSVKMVEAAILHCLRAHVFTPDLTDAVLAFANSFLRKQTTKPDTKLGSLKKELRQTQREIAQLVEVLKKNPSKSLGAVASEIDTLQQRQDFLTDQINTAVVRKNSPILPLERTEVNAKLTDLQALLSSDVCLSAPVLLELTGPIQIFQGEATGRKGTPWIAKFTLNVPSALAALPTSSKDPAWSQLSKQLDPSNNQLEVVIDTIPKYERLGPEFVSLREKGASISSIAKAYGMTNADVSTALRFAETGLRPIWKTKKRSDARGPNWSKFKPIIPIVVQLRDEEHLSWEEILSRLRSQGHEVGIATVQRAHSYAHRDEIRDSIDNGNRPKQHCHHRGKAERHAQIAKLLREQNLTVAEIAAQIGCSPQTVYRVRSTLHD